jgi:uncharacterized protein (TIGR02147 family)
MNTEKFASSQWIETEFISRRQKNSSLSLRAFAKFLKLPASRLSDFLKGKRSLTPQMALLICDRLSYGPEKRAQFLQLVHNDYQNSRTKLRKTPYSLDFADGPKADYVKLSEDIFTAISDWYYYAIINLSETTNKKLDAKYISNRIGLPVLEAQAALDRLLRLGLLVEKNGRLQAQHKDLTTTHEVKSVALRKAHKQFLEKAIDSIEGVDLELRDITSITMAIDPSKLKEAKELIKGFRRNLSQLLESNEAPEKKSEVYTLNIQLFPLTKIQKEKT